MKMKEVNKLYSGLLPEEQAVLVYNSVYQGNPDETAAVRDAVTSGWAYQHRAMGLFNFTHTFGILYWRHKCSRVSGTNPEPFLLDSMVVAALQICEKYTLDIDGFRLGSQTNNEDFSIYDRPNNRVDELFKCFESLII